MRSRRGLLTMALSLVLSTGLAASAQDAPTYQAEMIGQFKLWIMNPANVPDTVKGNLEGIDPISGVLEFPKTPPESIAWKFEVPADKKFANLTKVKDTLKGLLEAYLDSSGKQAMISVKVEGQPDAESEAKREALKNALKANIQILGFNPTGNHDDDDHPKIPDKSLPLASGQTYPSPQSHLTMPPAAPMASHVTPAVIPQVAAWTSEIPSGLITRDVLIKGKTAGDWESLFNLGYSSFRSGQYRQASEYFAAASELSDDPRAWDFLALTSILNGESSEAQQSARYAAAGIFKKVEFRDKVGLALLDVNGSLRDRLWQLQIGVDNPKVANTILAARPRLIPQPGQHPEVEVASKPVN